MKRLAVLALTAGVGLPATAAYPTPLPAPTALAPTVPVVPAPYAGAVVQPPAATRTVGNAEGGVRTRLAGMFRRSPEPEVYDPYPAKKAWCTDCAPAARQPLPPLPAGVDMGAYGVRRASATVPAPAATPPAPPALPPVVGGCADGHCPTPGRVSGSCWDCFKRWLCFRNTPVHLKPIPTERPAPQWTYGQCREGPGCASGAKAGCADGRCGPGFAAGGKPGAAGCAPCPTPGEVVMPGYRLANPEQSGMAAPRAAGPVVSPVAPAGYWAKPPAPVPSKGGAPASQRPYSGQ